MHDAHTCTERKGGGAHIISISLPVAVATRAPQHFASANSSSVRAEVNAKTRYVRCQRRLHEPRGE